MALDPFFIFVACVVLNVVLKVLTPFLGVFRRGIDTVLFCSVLIGHIYGSVTGALYGALIAMSYYILRSRQWDYAFFIVPINMIIGYIGGFTAEMDLLLAGHILFAVYHILSFIAIGLFLRRAEFKYGIFVIFNYITTILLLQASLYFMQFF
jgi:hypothetical protein